MPEYFLRICSWILLGRLSFRTVSAMCLGAYLAACVGCGQPDGGAAANVLKTGPVSMYLPYYHAYGDSNTVGVGLEDSETQAYPALVGKFAHLPVTNEGVQGDQACDTAQHAVANGELPGYAPSYATNSVFSLLIGTNDVDAKNVGEYEGVFNLCDQAAIAWLALPVENKVLGSSSLLTTAGAGFVDTTYNWNAWVTYTQGASVTFPVRLASAGPVYVWYRIIDGNRGTFSYAIDGQVLGTRNTETTPAIATKNGRTNSMAFLRISGISSGAHTVTFTQTSTDLYGMGIIGVGTLPTGSPAGLPTVLVGTVPPQRYIMGGNACDQNDAPCLQYAADITANAAVFSQDGLHVRLFNTRKYMSGTAADLADEVHLALPGHGEVAKVMQEALQ